MRCLVLDFGGSAVKYGLVNEQAQITGAGKLPAPIKSKEEFVDTVSQLYEQHKSQVDGIAISLPGYINSGTGYLSGSGAYQALYGCCIPELLHDRCPVNIAVENDGKCGALSEVWNGALHGCKDGAVLILGSAIGGGIIKDGRIHSGKGFAAGELSYFLVEPNKTDYSAMAMLHCCTIGMAFKLCKMKNLDITIQDCCELISLFDCLFGERFPTKEGIPEKIKVTGQQIMAWVEEGDADALQVYEEFIRSLTMMIFNLQVTYGPERVVIGGGLSCSDRILKDLRETLQRYYQEMHLPVDLQSELVRSQYLDECNLLGAAYHYFCKYGT